MQPGEEKAGRDADRQGSQNAARLLSKVGKLVHGVGSIGAAESWVWETRDELGILISGARRDYDLPANFCRPVSGGQLRPSRVIIYQRKE